MSPDLLDPPAPALSQHELARRRAHLRDEIRRAGAPPTRTPGPRPLAVAISLAAVVAVLAAVLPGELGRSRMTVVSQALAAIGKGPTIHVVFDYGRKPLVVDLRTGNTRLADARVEIWADPKLGSTYTQTLDGRVTEQYGPRTPGSSEVAAQLRAFVDGYRAQLRHGSYHAVGRGTVAGQPVAWIAGKPTVYADGTTQVEEIAISRTTFKPVALRWRVDGKLAPGSDAHVLVADTIPRDPRLFAHRHTIGGGYDALPLEGHGISTTTKAAKAAMNPDPVVPPTRIAGLRRTWIGEPALLLEPANSYRDQVVGVTYYYGPLDQWGLPAHTSPTTHARPFVAITEVADAHAAHTLWGPGLFRKGEIVFLPPTPSGRATLRTHGLYVLIQASTRASLIAAARALAR